MVFLAEPEGRREGVVGEPTVPYLLSIYISYMGDSVCNNQAYLNSIDQKRRAQLNNIPPVRYNNLANNFYDKINPATGQTYTKFDLDMRRKAEILKYSSNRVPTQTNSLTKAERYRQAVNGIYQQRTYSQAFIAENTENGILQTCPPGVIVKTPSSASGVPGNMLLYDDPAIPLYNLINTTNTPYGIINQAADPYVIPWNYAYNANASQETGETPIIFTLYIFNIGSAERYAFSFQTPFSIGFSGKWLPNIISSNNASFSIQVNTIALSVLYSYSAVTLNPTPSYIQQYNTSINVDISNNAATFSGRCFFDNVQFSNIVLPSRLGYIYDIQLAVSYNIFPNNEFANQYETPVITTFFNATTPISPTRTRCSISGSPVITSFLPLSIQGTPA